MKNILRNAVLVVIPLAVVAAVAGGTYMLVSGSDDDAPDLGAIEVPAGRVSCEMFEVARGYRYESIVVLDLKDREPGVEPDQDPSQPEGFLFTTDMVGDVEGTEATHQIASYPENDQIAEFIAVDDATYEKRADGQWTEADTTSGFQIPYIPGAACNALAPDIFLDDVEGTPEEVQGVAAVKYHYDALQTDFPDRHPSFGPASDAARFVNTWVGDVWVAEEGGYIIKMDLVGVGQYPNGRELEISYAYELHDVNAKINIEAPI